MGESASTIARSNRPTPSAAGGRRPLLPDSVESRAITMTRLTSKNVTPSDPRYSSHICCCCCRIGGSSVHVVLNWRRLKVASSGLASYFEQVDYAGPRCNEVAGFSSTCQLLLGTECPSLPAHAARAPSPEVLDRLVHEDALPFQTLQDGVVPARRHGSDDTTDAIVDRRDRDRGIRS